MLRMLCGLIGLLLVAPALAQTAVPAPGPAPALPRVALVTSAGTITVEVDNVRA
ncbi:MAG: peptidylprolyl isomerase, partial [Bradyrhizobium sp.]|nr:peptidylprolyl isomerase [Bradyrhizobium sp.]